MQVDRRDSYTCERPFTEFTAGDRRAGDCGVKVSLFSVLGGGLLPLFFKGMD